MRKGIYVLSAVLGLLAFGYATTALGYPLGGLARPGPAFFPLLVVSPLLLLGAVGMALEVRGAGRERVGWPDGPGWLRVAVVLATVTCYVALAQTIGHALAAGLLSLALLSVFGLWRLPVRLAAAVVLAVGTDILFGYLLNAPLPRGPFGWYW
jgi:predicted Abi (CAAX) family protease